MDPNERSCVVKIDKGLQEELEQQLMEFLCQNQDVFTWTHADMVGIHSRLCATH